MKPIQWRETAQRFGSPVQTAFVGNAPMAVVAYAMRSQPLSYSWTVHLPVPHTARGSMSGRQPDAALARAAARAVITQWFKETE